MLARERVFCSIVTEKELPKSGNVLGVDYGTVRIGLALGELGSGLVLPLPVLSNPGSIEEAAARIADVARGRDAVLVVLGDPVHMSGEKSAMSVQVEKLAEALSARLEAPVIRRDERLSSVSAEEQLSQAGLRWWQYEKGKIDQLAAMSLVRETLIEIKPELGRIASEDEPQVPNPSRREKAERRRDARKKRRDRPS